MKPAQSFGPDYDARIRRAQHLAGANPFAAEVLSLYQQVAAFQKKLCGKIASSPGGVPSGGARLRIPSELNLTLLLPHFPELLALLEHAGPSPVAQAVRELATRDPAEWSAMLTDFWMFGGRASDAESEAHGESEKPLTEFILRAFLQPYAEFLALRMPAPQLETTYRVCPRCGSAPLVGVLHLEGDGGKRSLMCSFCMQEWEFRRILCAACGEEAENKLPVYVAEQFPHVRVEACDTCKSYLRTIDLTKDGHAVPVVDDLGAIPLSLWAQEHGYTRLQQNLLGA
jgi:FdhE protein